MMRGRLYIDGVDVYVRFGVYIIEKGLRDLVSYHPLKSIRSNDWQEEDGIEADLSNPVLNTKNVKIQFAISGVQRNFAEFVAFLSDGAYHVFRCVDIAMTFKLRLVSSSDVDLANKLGFVSLTFADDFPLFGYEYQEPSCVGITQSDSYLLDGRRLSDYSVIILQGSLDEVRKYGEVKQALLRNIQSQNGAIYDSCADVRYNSKEVRLFCLLRASNPDEMWRNYNALLYDMIRPGERILYVEELDKEFPCYYKSSKVSDFSFYGRVWLEFTVTLTFTRDFRYVEEVLLATESDTLVITDDSESYIEL